MGKWRLTPWMLLGWGTRTARIAGDKLSCVILLLNPSSTEKSLFKTTDHHQTQTVSWDGGICDLQVYLWDPGSLLWLLTAQPSACHGCAVPVDLCRIRPGRQRGKTRIITAAPLKHLFFGMSAWTLHFFPYAGYSPQCFWTVVLCSLRENVYLD